jgi:transketolase
MTIRELVQINSNKPRAIVAHTVKGKGISFMEGDNRWHYTRLTPESYAAAIAELDSPELEMVR